MKRLIGILLMVIFIAPSNAYAHTALVSSTPKNGAVLTKSPTTISLTFNEQLIKLGGKNVSRISLVDLNEKQIKFGKVTVSRSKISAPLNQTLNTGSYTIKYRVVSADGHPVTGSIKFNIR